MTAEAYVAAMAHLYRLRTANEDEHAYDGWWCPECNAHRTRKAAELCPSCADNAKRGR